MSQLFLKAKFPTIISDDSIYKIIFKSYLFFASFIKKIPRV